VVEVDGGVHLHAPNYWADARRQNELVLGGDRVLRFSSYAIRVEEDVVIAQLRRAHQVFG
jgi:very-short-patch-repair endonuclease